MKQQFINEAENISPIVAPLPTANVVATETILVEKEVAPEKKKRCAYRAQ